MTTSCTVPETALNRRLVGRQRQTQNELAAATGAVAGRAHAAAVQLHQAPKAFLRITLGDPDKLVGQVGVNLKQFDRFGSAFGRHFRQKMDDRIA